MNTPTLTATPGAVAAAAKLREAARTMREARLTLDMTRAPCGHCGTPRARHKTEYRVGGQITDAAAKLDKWANQLEHPEWGDSHADATT